MTSHRRYQFAASVGAAVVATIGAACAYRGLYLVAAMFGITFAVLLEAAARERRRHFRVLDEHAWARQRALGLNPKPLRPCCLLGQATRGSTHRQCTDVSVAALFQLAADDEGTA